MWLLRTWTAVEGVWVEGEDIIAAAVAALAAAAAAAVAVAVATAVGAIGTDAGLSAAFEAGLGDAELLLSPSLAAAWPCGRRVLEYQGQVTLAPDHVTCGHRPNRPNL